MRKSVLSYYQAVNHPFDFVEALESIGKSSPRYRWAQKQIEFIESLIHSKGRMSDLETEIFLEDEDVCLSICEKFRKNVEFSKFALAVKANRKVLVDADSLHNAIIKSRNVNMRKAVTVNKKTKVSMFESYVSRAGEAGAPTSSTRHFFSLVKKHIPEVLTSLYDCGYGIVLFISSNNKKYLFDTRSCRWSSGTPTWYSSSGFVFFLSKYTRTNIGDVKEFYTVNTAIKLTERLDYSTLSNVASADPVIKRKLTM